MQVSLDIIFQIAELKNKLFGYESGPASVPKKSTGSSVQTEEIER